MYEMQYLMAIRGDNPISNLMVTLAQQPRAQLIDLQNGSMMLMRPLSTSIKASTKIVHLSLLILAMALNFHQMTQHQIQALCHHNSLSEVDLVERSPELARRLHQQGHNVALAPPGIL